MIIIYKMNKSLILQHKGSLLPALQHPVLQPILLADSKQPSLYRLVLEHGDFGCQSHSMQRLSHLWRPFTTGIVLAILSDPTMSLCFDLVEDKNGAALSHTRKLLFAAQALYEQVPNYIVQYRERRTPPFVYTYKTGQMSIRKNDSLI